MSDDNLALDLVLGERRHQIAEGRTAEHDDQHTDGTIAVIAATLLVHETDAKVADPLDRGTDADTWGLVAKHGDNHLRLAVIAAALALAELERVIRRDIRDRVKGGS